MPTSLNKLVPAVLVSLWTTFSLLGCSTESLPSNLQRVESDNPGGLATVDMVLATKLFGPTDADTRDGEVYRILFNGNFLVLGDELVRVNEGSGFHFGVEPGNYYIELMDDNDQTVLRTDVNTFTQDQQHTLVVYNTPDDLRHHFWRDDLSQVPDGQAIVRVINAMNSGETGQALSCPLDTLDCQNLGAVAYGDVWEGTLPRGESRLAFELALPEGFPYSNDILAGSEVGFAPYAQGFPSRLAVFIPVHQYSAANESCRFCYAIHEVYEWVMP